MGIIQKPVTDSADANVFSKPSDQPAEIQSLKNTPKRFDQLRMAKLISLMLHPFLISPLSIILILYLDGEGIWAAVGWAGLCAAFVVAPGLVFLYRKLKLKHYSDADVSNRDQRHGFYIFGAVCMIFCFATLLWLDAPRLLITSFLAALAAIIVSAIVTRLWSKVSIHSGVISGVTTMISFYSLPLAFLLALGTLLVIWSRLVLKRHSLSEAVLGGVIAVSCMLLTLTSANGL